MKSFLTPTATIGLCTPRAAGVDTKDAQLSSDRGAKADKTQTIRPALKFSKFGGDS